MKIYLLRYNYLDISYIRIQDISSTWIDISLPVDNILRNTRTQKTLWKKKWKKLSRNKKEDSRKKEKDLKATTNRGTSEIYC